jgi:hypothetical protein
LSPNAAKAYSHAGDTAPEKTYRVPSAASARAAPLPLIPTETPQIKLQNPTVIPPQNKAYPV